MKRIPALLMAAALLAIGATAAHAEEPPQEDGSFKLSVMDELPLSSGQAAPTPRPFDMEYREAGNRAFLIRRFELNPGQDATQITGSIYEQGDARYRLLEVLQKELDASVDSKIAYQTVTVNTESADRAAILTQLSPLVEYSEGGYSGQLTLDYASIQTAASGTKNYAYPIKTTREFAGLDRADVSYIPKSIQNSYGADLRLADVEWTSLGAAQSGDNDLPSSFTAQAVYTATGYGTMATGYTTTAQYLGEVRREIPGNTLYSLVYEEIPDHTGAAIRMYFTLALVTVALSVAIVYTIIRHREQTGKPPAEQPAKPLRKPRGKGAQDE